MYRKSTHTKLFVISIAFILAAMALFRAADVPAQEFPDLSGEETRIVAADVLSCWWKSDKSAVHIGEEFTITLTCRSAETGSEKTVINESLLDPNVLTLPPYQVKNGRRYKNLKRILPGPNGPVTFNHMQYDYTVTLMGESFFGKEVPLPPLEIRYHIDLVVDKATVTPGKERSYNLSPLPVMIQSLVPRAADSIRDAGIESFGDIENHRKNAIVAFIAAGLFLLFPLLFLLPILLQVVRSRRENAFNGSGFSDRDLLRRLVGELSRLEEICRRTSWDEVSIGKALSLLRVGGALTIGHKVAQVPVKFDTRGREGQLEFHKGIWPRTTVLVSASLTPEEMTDELTVVNWQGVSRARLKALGDEIQKVFAVFNNIRYTALENSADREMLDSALKKGLMLLQTLRRDYFRTVRMVSVVVALCHNLGRKWKQS